MEEFKVIIPDEMYTIVEYKRDNLPAIMVINSALVDFEPKEVFSWNLSILIQFNELADNGMPAKNETDLIESFENYLFDNLKDDKKKPNALFFARITWNGTREIIYRVYDPEIANNLLQNIINDKKYPREFDYRMEADEGWKLNKVYFDLFKNSVRHS
jgi:hypothetical protein